MVFGRLIKLRLACQVRNRTQWVVFVAVTSLTCGLLQSSLYAGCGDYVILTGQIPSHLREQLAEQPMAGHEVLRAPINRDRLTDLFIPNTPQPCQGPSCGQRRSPAMATTPIVADDQQQQNFFCSSDTDSARKNRAGRYGHVNEPLLSSDLHLRIDRPPRV